MSVQYAVSDNDHNKCMVKVRRMNNQDFSQSELDENSLI